MTALRQEIAPFGIHATIVNPGWFRTGLAGPESLVWPDLVIDDYAERSAAQQKWWQAQDGHQAGDPRKLADAVVTLAAMDPPPDRFFAGRDVFDIAERKIAELQAAIDALPELSTSLTVDEPVDNPPTTVGAGAGQYGELVEQRILKGRVARCGCRFLDLLVEPVTAGHLRCRLVAGREPGLGEVAEG